MIAGSNVIKTCPELQLWETGEQDRDKAESPIAPLGQRAQNSIRIHPELPTENAEGFSTPETSPTEDPADRKAPYPDWSK